MTISNSLTLLALRHEPRWQELLRMSLAWSYEHGTRHCERWHYPCRLMGCWTRRVWCGNKSHLLIRSAAFRGWQLTNLLYFILEFQCHNFFAPLHSSGIQEGSWLYPSSKSLPGVLEDMEILDGGETDVRIPKITLGCLLYWKFHYDPTVTWFQRSMFYCMLCCTRKEEGRTVTLYKYTDIHITLRELFF